MLHQQFKSDLKDSMMKKDEIRLRVIRGLLSSFTNELVAKNRKPSDELSDDEILAVITRNVKQRKDSIEQFTSGGRPDLAEEEKKELEILSQYLPAQMSEQEIKSVVEKKKAELNVSDKTGAGLLMKSVMAECKSKADGALVKKIVDESLG
jgi:uncharacterized protein